MLAATAATLDKTLYFTTAITLHINEISTWFKLYMNCITVFLCISDHFFITLKEQKIVHFKIRYFAMCVFLREKNHIYFSNQVIKKRVWDALHDYHIYKSAKYHSSIMKTGLFFAVVNWKVTKWEKPADAG